MSYTKYNISIHRGGEYRQVIKLFLEITYVLVFLKFHYVNLTPQNGTENFVSSAMLSYVGEQ